MNFRHRGSNRRSDRDCLSRGAAQDDLLGGLARQHSRRNAWPAVVTALAGACATVCTVLTLTGVGPIGHGSSSSPSTDPGHGQLVLRTSTTVVQFTLTIEQRAHRRRHVMLVRIRRESAVWALTTFNGLLGWAQLDAAVGNQSL